MRTLFGLAAAAMTAAALPAQANTLIIGFGPGGGYDTWGRTVARHLGDHLPGNPDFVAKNMPGAGSLKAANYIYNAAPKDGSVIAIIARDAALIPLSGLPGAKFDARKFTWLGSPTAETNVCIAYKTAPVDNAKELFTKQLIVGNTGVGTGTYTYPTVLKAILGMKFKIIGGYQSSSNVFLAMERGEVQGICESYDSVVGKRPNWIKDGVVKVLFQAGIKPNPHIKAPSIFEFAKTKEQKQALNYIYAGQGIGRPFVAPPDLPADVKKTLTTAFQETMHDPKFIADAEKQGRDVEPVSGEDIRQIVVELYDTPQKVIDKINKILGKAKKH